MVSVDQIRARLAAGADAIQENHYEVTQAGSHLCGECMSYWPCETAKAIPGLHRAHKDALTLLAERDAQIAAVRELHRAREIAPHMTEEMGFPRQCRACRVNSPCPTIAALDAKGGAS